MNSMNPTWDSQSASSSPVKRQDATRRHVKDMSKEWDSISELDQRISIIDQAVKQVKGDVNKHMSPVQELCDKLIEPSVELERSSQILVVVKELLQLDELCNEIKLIKDTSIAGFDDAQDGCRLGLDLVETYDRIYSPLEPILSKRKDLQYHKIYLSLKQTKNVVA